MMTMKEFASNVEQHILEHLPEEFAGATVDVTEVVKDRDKHLFGLSVKKEGGNYAPILYLDDFYQKHCCDEISDLKDAMQQIAKAYLEIAALTPRFEMPELTKENVKDHLRLRLVNTEWNEDGLKDLVCKHLDSGLSLTAVMDVGKDGFTRISKKMAESLGYDESEMLEDAMGNTVRNSPAKLVDLRKVLFCLAGNSNGKDEDNLLSCVQSPEDTPPVLVLTTNEQFEGAVTICYPGVTEKISQVVGGNYYVLPSSIHELLIMPDNGLVDPKDLRKMIRSVNAQEVSPSEQLGDDPLYYNAATGLLKIAG